jgi:hypothetical protein
MRLHPACGEFFLAVKLDRSSHPFSSVEIPGRALAWRVISRDLAGITVEITAFRPIRFVAQRGRPFHRRFPFSRL